MRKGRDIMLEPVGLVIEERSPYMPYQGSLN